MKKKSKKNTWMKASKKKNYVCKFKHCLKRFPTNDTRYRHSLIHVEEFEYQFLNQNLSFKKQIVFKRNGNKMCNLREAFKCNIGKIFI